MISDRETAIKVIRGLPEDASLEEIAEELGIFAAIRKGERDADTGRTVSHEEMKRRFRQWIGRQGG